MFVTFFSNKGKKNNLSFFVAVAMNHIELMKKVQE